jgi:SH3-like domain-containing protein
MGHKALMRSYFTILLLLLLFCMHPAHSIAQQTESTTELHPMLRHSGLPIPRFVTLKGGVTNLRVGPGRDYPIAWVYRRQGYPLEVIKEFGHWRQVRDVASSEGEEGWVHANLLSGARAVIINPAAPLTLAPLYAAASDTSRQVMEAEAGALLKLRSCTLEWCQITAPNKRSVWIAKIHLLGVYDEEVFGD